MAFVLIDQLPAGSADDEVLQLLQAVDAHMPRTLQIAAGLDEHVAASLAYDDEAYARAVVAHLNGYSWKGRALSALFLPSALG